MGRVGACNVTHNGKFISGLNKKVSIIIPYLLVYKLTLYDQKISWKNCPRIMYESYTKTSPVKI